MAALAAVHNKKPKLTYCGADHISAFCEMKRAAKKKEPDVVEVVDLVTGNHMFPASVESGHIQVPDVVHEVDAGGCVRDRISSYVNDAPTDACDSDGLEVQ